MNKNVLIVNFNTQKMTEACIKSINKCCNDCYIYIFDNSDKTPFKNIFSNVKIIDNTEGQIVNFNDVIEKHKDHLNPKAGENNFGSAKHCLSVDAAMSIITDGFVLMDSDILIKKDFSALYDETKIFVGHTEKMPRFVKRLAPFLAYINVKMCKEHNIHFFDENHMFGFYTDKSGADYDTGCWFYEQCKDLPKKEISINQYMVHFRAASWYKDAVEKQNYKQVTPEKWLERNRRYWFVKENGQQSQEPEHDQTAKKDAVERGNKVVMKRIATPKTGHMTTKNQIKKATLTGRKIALIKRS